jgi:hypothetical protein
MQVLTAPFLAFLTWAPSRAQFAAIPYHPFRAQRLPVAGVTRGCGNRIVPASASQKGSFTANLEAVEASIQVPF